MISKRMPALPNGIKSYLIISIKSEISTLGSSQGYASKMLGIKLMKLGFTNSMLVTRTELTDILHKLA